MPPILLLLKLRVWRCVQVLFLDRCCASSTPIEFDYKLRVLRYVQIVFIARYLAPSSPIEFFSKSRVWRYAQVVFWALSLAIYLLFVSPITWRFLNCFDWVFANHFRYFSSFIFYSYHHLLLIWLISLFIVAFILFIKLSLIIFL